MFVFFVLEDKLRPQILVGAGENLPEIFFRTGFACPYIFLGVGMDEICPIRFSSDWLSVPTVILNALAKLAPNGTNP
ncbi:MAG: hypothetical protein N3B10_05670 [Armatimonadetes bacterium]|nr:hypothetical protein [Armatimonadota bacterium]